MSKNHGYNTDSAGQEKQHDDDARTTSFGSGAPPTSNQRIHEPSKEASSSVGGEERFFDVSVSETASPETGELNADQGGVNAEAYSTPTAPDRTMKFESFEEVVAHYELYALRNGFGTRIEYTRTLKDNIVSRALLVCGKGGKPKKKEEEVQDVLNPEGIMKKRKRRKVKRTECPAHLYLMHKDVWWRVERFGDNHNHPLIRKPSLTKFLASHRNIPKDEQDFLRILHECNIDTARQMQLTSWFYR